ncbi:PilN domain-containing protein [Pantoea deleyi]|uniref:PilN domain-containing protein n=2 Tax=Pantoea deleyi TaxID=470932 RepID=A0A506PSU2_9GAMM|nr:PilN domain-containing protein [Pantoea deleyi]TPV36362.1 PilN domain-containing protein [Pantoea deleyi]
MNEAVNLLPWRQRRQRRQQRQSLVVLVLVTLSLLLAVMQQVWRIEQARQGVAQAAGAQQQALDHLAKQLAEQNALLAQLAVVQKQQAKQRRARAQLAAWQRFWLALPALLPDSAWLTWLEKRDQHLTLEGRAQDMVAIRQFRQGLTTVALFDQVKQGGVKRQPDGRYQFSLRLRLREGNDE